MYPCKKRSWELKSYRREQNKGSTQSLPCIAFTMMDIFGEKWVRSFISRSFTCFSSVPTGKCKICYDSSLSESPFMTPPARSHVTQQTETQKITKTEVLWNKIWNVRYVERSVLSPDMQCSVMWWRQKTFRSNVLPPLRGRKLWRSEASWWCRDWLILRPWRCSSETSARFQPTRRSYNVEYSSLRDHPIKNEYSLIDFLRKILAMSSRFLRRGYNQSYMKQASHILTLPMYEDFLIIPQDSHNIFTADTVFLGIIFCILFFFWSMR